jgi:threonine dehydratase
MFALTLDALEAAAKTFGRVLQPTPQICWPLLCARAGTEVWVKHENHLPTGAFKVRGGIVYMQRLRERRPDVGGIIAATRGNHGQSVAYAGSLMGIGIRVVVPHGNSAEKNLAMRAYGAELIEHGDDFQEALEHAGALAEEQGLHFVPSFGEDLVAGVASYGLELFEAVRDLDVVYVPIGLGSGVCGVMAARDALGLRTEVVGVVSAEAPAYALSLQAGRPVEARVAPGVADGMAVRTPNAEALEMILKGRVRTVTVSEAEIRAAMRALFSDTHNVAEGAGAAAFAALMQERERQRGRKVAVILSGGNVDRSVFAEILAGS